MEKNERYFDIRGIVLKILFLLLFVFLLLWLAPYPKEKVVYDHLYNENLENIKDAAKSYYTIDRLPMNLGEKDSLTVREMLDMKIILPFLDGNGKECDLNESYVEITRMEDEYILKVYLQCDTKSDYILEHIGCYDICDDCGELIDFEEECDKEEEEKETEDITEYYLKKTDSSPYWTSFGKWTTDYLVETSTRKRRQEIEVTGKIWNDDSYTKYEHSKDVIETITLYKGVKDIQEPYDERVAVYGWVTVNVIGITSYASSWDCDPNGCEYVKTPIYGVVGTKKVWKFLRWKTVIKYKTVTVDCNNGEYVAELSSKCREIDTKQEEIVTGQDIIWTINELEPGYEATGNTEPVEGGSWSWYNDGKFVFETELPNDYTVVEIRKKYSYKYLKSSSKISYKWHSSKNLSGWEYTGQTRTRTVTL